MIRSHHYFSVNIQIMSGKVCLRCEGKILLGVVNKLLGTQKVYWHHPAMFCLIISSKHFRQNFEFSLKVMGSNPSYLLKYFLLYDENENMFWILVTFTHPVGIVGAEPTTILELWENIAHTLVGVCKSIRKEKLL